MILIWGGWGNCSGAHTATRVPRNLEGVFGNIIIRELYQPANKLGLDREQLKEQMLSVKLENGGRKYRESSGQFIARAAIGKYAAANGNVSIQKHFKNEFPA